MTKEETIAVIKNELQCVQRDCCRLENECSKCDLVLPQEQIVEAYKNVLNILETEKWHFVKEELPPRSGVYIIYTTKGYLLGNYEQGGADREVRFDGEPISDFTEYPSEESLLEKEVIAWKEIVLLTLSELLTYRQTAT